jgi:hypothetical protein
MKNPPSPTTLLQSEMKRFDVTGLRNRCKHCKPLKQPKCTHKKDILKIIEDCTCSWGTTDYDCVVEKLLVYLNT